MENRRNFYRILHVQFDAPEAVIRASYRTIMQKLRQHPDLGGDKWNAALINEAYAVLSDPKRRAAYDTDFLAEHGKQEPYKTSSNPSAADKDHEAKPNPESQEGATEKGAAGIEPEVKPTSTPKTDTRQSPGHCPFCSHANLPTATECGRCRSPLTPAPQVSATIDARRHIERIPVRERAALYDRWPQKVPYVGEVRDVSPKGCQVMVLHLVTRGSRIKIDSPLFSAIGTVQSSRVNVSPSGKNYVLAVQFVTLRFAHTEGSFVSIDA